MNIVAGNTVCFGPFKLDLKAGELHRDGRKIRLQEQPFQVLKMMLEHPGQVVTREIKKKLWPNDTMWSSTTASTPPSRSCAWR
jgi:DNA-binding winged helix-turn-helix (wHTH) protein